MTAANVLFANIRRTRNADDAKVGDRFIATDDRPYRQEGGKGTHHREILWEVTSLEDFGFAARPVAVVREAGRPSFATDPTGLQVAFHAWDRYLADGTYRLVESE